MRSGEGVIRLIDCTTLLRLNVLFFFFFIFILKNKKIYGENVIVRFMIIIPFICMWMNLMFLRLILYYIYTLFTLCELVTGAPAFYFAPLFVVAWE